MELNIELFFIIKLLLFFTVQPSLVSFQNLRGESKHQYNNKLMIESYEPKQKDVPVPILTKFTLELPDDRKEEYEDQQFGN